MPQCIIVSHTLVSPSKQAPWSLASHGGLDLLDGLWELLPVVHDDLGVAGFGERLGHLLLLGLALLETVDSDVGDEWDACTHAGSGSGLAVLDSQALLWLDTELLAGVEVDGGVGLAGWWVERGGSRVDGLVGEEAHEVGLLEGCNDTWLGGGRDDRHWVALSLGPLELLSDTWALDALLAQLGSDAAELHVDILVDLLRRHGEVVLLLEADEHVAEIVADEVLEQRVGGVASIDAVLLQNLIGEVGTSFEGETLRLAEGVVAVEEDVLDLQLLSVSR